MQPLRFSVSVLFIVRRKNTRLYNPQKQRNVIVALCAMYLSLGYLDGATQFAQSCGGGGVSSDLPWGRNLNRHFAYCCMMQAHKMLKPAKANLCRGRGY